MIRGPDDKPGRLRKKDIYICGVSLLVLLSSTLDADGEQLADRLRFALLVIGSAGAAWFFYRLLRSGNFAESDLKAYHRRTLLLSLFVVHLVATFFFFPIEHIANDKPVLNLDHSFHYYQVVRSGEVFFNTGRLHCYDPFFMAGYPTAIFDLDVKAAELFCAPFGRGGAAGALKAFILICYLTLLPTVYRGSRMIGFGAKEALLGLLVLLVYWHWGRPYASHFRYAGMFGFVFVSHLSLLTVGLFRHFLEGRAVFLFFVVGPLTFLIHPTAVVILAVPFLILCVSWHRRFTRKRRLQLLLWCGAVLAVNAIWVWPMFQYLDVKTTSTAYFQIAGMRGLAHELFKPSCLPALFLIGLALLGSLQLWNEKRRIELAATSGTALALVILVAYGVYLPGVSQLEPGRFLFPAIVFLAPTAGRGALRALDLARRIVGAERGRVAIEAAVVALVLVQLPLAALTARRYYEHRLTTTVTAKVQALLDALDSHMDDGGRLMVEDGPAYLYGDANIPALLPLRSGVEQIGGPYPTTFVRHHFTTFQSDRTMGVPLARMSPELLQSYLDLYEVTWIVTATASGYECVSRMQRDEAGDAGRAIHGTVPRVVWQEGRFTLWAVDRQPSFAMSGGARVSATYDRIEIEMDDPHQPILLRYHWDKGLTVAPPSEISPVYRLKDPVPFIFLAPNGARTIVIRF